MSAATRRRWTARVHLPDGTTGVVVLEAHEGFVFGQLGDAHVRLTPRECAHLRGRLGDALAAALQERDDW